MSDLRCVDIALAAGLTTGKRVGDEQFFRCQSMTMSTHREWTTSIAPKNTIEKGHASPCSIGMVVGHRKLKDGHFAVGHIRVGSCHAVHSFRVPPAWHVPVGQGHGFTLWPF